MVGCSGSRQSTVLPLVSVAPGLSAVRSGFPTPDIRSAADLCGERTGYIMSGNCEKELPIKALHRGQDQQGTNHQHCGSSGFELVGRRSPIHSSSMEE